jgi:hypothetical protein
MWKIFTVLRIIGVMQLSGYMELLKKREGNKRITRAHQLTGLEVADILSDRAHKSLYIKLAKIHGSSRIMAIAKDVADRASVRHRAAYFMRVVQSQLGLGKSLPVKKTTKKHSNA